MSAVGSGQTYRNAMNDCFQAESRLFQARLMQPVRLRIFIYTQAGRMRVGHAVA